MVEAFIIMVNCHRGIYLYSYCHSHFFYGSTRPLSQRTFRCLLNILQGSRQQSSSACSGGNFDQTTWQSPLWSFLLVRLDGRFCQHWCVVASTLSTELALHLRHLAVPIPSLPGGTLIPQLLHTVLDLDPKARGVTFHSRNSEKCCLVECVCTS
jgi:hypothetical protein